MFRSNSYDTLEELCHQNPFLARFSFQNCLNNKLFSLCDSILAGFTTSRLP